MASKIENLIFELNEYARQIRLSNSTDSFLHKIKDCLNLVYGPERNHITNIDTDEAFRTTLNSLGLSTDAIDNGDDELFDQVLARAKQALRYSVVIHFPQVTITNSDDLSHIIRDLYVRLNFDVNGKLVGSVEGIRITGTNAEIITGYCHSHLVRQTWDYMSFKEFCTGEGPIKYSIINLMESFDIVEFQILCNHVNNLVCWESTEGRPHVYMSEIHINEGVSRVKLNKTSGIIKNGFLDFLWTLPAAEIALLFHFSYSNNIIIKPTELLEEYIVHFLESIESRDQDDIVYKDFQGNYYFLNNNTSSVPTVDTDRVVFKFKNIPKRIKIIDNDTVIQPKKYPNPGYTNEICEEFGKKFRITLGRKIRNEAERAHSYTRQSMAANTAPAS